MYIDDIHVGAAVYRPLTELSSSTTTNKAVVVGDFPCEQGAMKNEEGMALFLGIVLGSKGPLLCPSDMTVSAAFRREPEQLL